MTCTDVYIRELKTDLGSIIFMLNDHAIEQWGENAGLTFKEMACKFEFSDNVLANQDYCYFRLNKNHTHEEATKWFFSYENAAPECFFKGKGAAPFNQRHVAVSKTIYKIAILQTRFTRTCLNT